MSLIRNLLLQGCSLWHNQPIFEPQCAFCVFVETSDL
jgi:hypothetical protein